ALIVQEVESALDWEYSLSSGRTRRLLTRRRLRPPIMRVGRTRPADTSVRSPRKAERRRQLWETRQHAPERRDTRCRPTRFDRPFGRLLAVLAPLLMVGWLAPPAFASTTHDLRGVWNVGPDPAVHGHGAGTQTWNITAMNLASGSFTGTNDA